MFKLFTSSYRPILGLDLSSSSVKLIELHNAGENYRVESYAVVPLPWETIVDRKIKDPDTLVQAIQKAVEKANTKSDYAALAVPDSMVISKVIQMDAELNEDDMELQIAVEADKYIPYPLEEVSLDFNVLHKNPEQPHLNDVLLVASRSENVEMRQYVLDQVGLTLRIVDVESYAMQRSVDVISRHIPNFNEESVIAIFDIGSVMTNLTVIQEQNTIFSREEVFGGEQLTRAIQSQYGLSYAEAGLAKKQGGLPEGYQEEVLQPFLDTAVLQVRRALQFFFSASNCNRLDHIVLAGGTASITGLATLLEDQIGIPTMIANPFQDMVVADKVDAIALTRDAPALMIATGLALRSFL